MDKLTKKEQGFVRDYVETGNGVQSALKNYDTDSYKTASNIASTNLDKPRIQAAISSIADKIPDELLAQVHMDGLNAVRMAGENAEIDFGVRHKYLDSAYKLKGSYAAEKKDITTNGETLNTNDPKLLALAEKYEQELKKSL